MWLVVGLGNHGPKYLMTRHNIGFMVADKIAYSQSKSLEKLEQKSLVGRVRLSGEDVLLAKPQTYMNLSGESIGPLSKYYKIENENIIVVQDDIDQPFGGMKIQVGRGHGGHNGIKSLNQHLPDTNYVRLKIGVGRPENPRMDVADFVLQNFSTDEQAWVPELLDISLEAIECIVSEGYQKAANKFNRKDALNRSE